MSPPDNAALGIARLDTSIAIARHRRDIPSVSGVLLSPATAEHLRVQEILRRAGHSIQSTDDHEAVLDLVADARPNLIVIAVDSDGNAIHTVKMIRVLAASWAKEIKIIAIGECASSSVDAVVTSVPDLASLCRQLRAEPEERVLDGLPNLIRSIRQALVHARANASQAVDTYSST